MAGEITFTVNGRTLQAAPGETILQACKRYGIDIPHLCYQDGQRPDGNCRACVVEIEGERLLAPSCSRLPAAGMAVRTDSERAGGRRRWSWSCFWPTRLRKATPCATSCAAGARPSAWRRPASPRACRRFLPTTIRR